MFNKLRLQEVLTEYKKHFVQKQWPEEKYKWEAVKCFQANWDINADNFADMLSKALSKTENLLASSNNFPAKMITKFAQAAWEEVRAMFINLFDERKELYERIASFKQKSGSLLKRYGNGAAQHYQNENSISTYLWLCYPDKYYIYKLTEIQVVSKVLESNYIFKKGDYANNIHNFLSFYNEICAELQKDNELKNLLTSQITKTCHPDSKLKTLTIDVCFFISQYFHKYAIPPVFWKISHGNNYITDAQADSFDKRRVVVVHKDTAAKGKSKISQGEAFMTNVKKGDFFYLCRGNSIQLLGRIDTEETRENPEKRNGWYERSYTIIAESRDKAPYTWAKKWWTPNDNSTCISVPEDKLTQFEDFILKPYFNITTEELLQNPALSAKGKEEYQKIDFLHEVYMPEDKYDRLAAVLKKKKNIILQGAPGVGKTFAAKRLAYSIMGEIDNDRIEFVQFHQNYSYEDFVMGYKPVDNGFELKYGIFYRFCQKAANHPEKDYFFLIDEINRGNMSKIFGELLMLIESDYREEKITLAYNGLGFSVPKRLHIIGMMNTADRSLAMIDYALRRRFSFFDMEPGFDSEGFINYQKGFANDTFDTLINCIKDLNNEITRDRSLGRGFCIGHSYFCNADECTEEWMRDVVDFDILPMLSEYWFDDADKLQRWENILHGVFQ